MPSVIRTEKLSRTFSESKVTVQALNEVDIQVMAGEFTAIVGPSGSGKTTLLNLIGGLDKPTSGKVWVGDKEVTALRGNAVIDFRLHNIGFVFQAYNLIPVLTAVENVEFILMLQGMGANERHERAMELLKRVGLEDKARQRPATLSGGQQQRVAVARALASRPHFILADEPTANLDSTSANQLLDLMEELNRTEGMTFLLSTHDARVISRARRVVTLEDGQIMSDVVPAVK